MMTALSGIFAGLKTIAGPVTEWVKGKAELKRIDMQSQIDLKKASTSAQIERIKSDQTHEQNWENKQIDNSGWKDEFYVLLFSIPLVMCFVPGLVQYVTDGFEALDKCPDWYKWAIGIMVSASFGYRRFADFMGKRQDKQQDGGTN